MQVNFNNKVVIVTGSNAGNGFAIAKAYSNLNAKVIRVDKNFTSKLKTIDIKFNLENYSKIKELFLKIKKITKKVDILINNAGISKQNKYPYSDFKSYHQTLAVNLHSPFYLISYLSKIMPRKKSTDLLS